MSTMYVLPADSAVLSKHSNIINGAPSLAASKDFPTMSISNRLEVDNSANFAKRMAPKSSKNIVDSSNDVCCSCQMQKQERIEKKPNLNPQLLQEKLKEQEEKLREEFKETLQKEISYLKDRFDFILENEQARASCMLREAHRERKEKIAALQQQLECKNMAGLMYVMCAERTKCKVEKMQIIETYTQYINMLNHILNDGQELILNLSRGFKTAARVNYEWQEKMKKVIAEFQAFIYHFSGTPPDQNQYLLNLPQLLQIEATTEDDPSEDPIEEEKPEPVRPEDLDANKEWWQKLDEECRPFAVFGDLGDFDPDKRRMALKNLKEAKTVPRKWKEYMFNEMFLNSNCPNADRMKEQYFDRIPDPSSYDCHDGSYNWDAKAASRRLTTQSVDIRGNMGSILKIITTTGHAEPVTKANLLGARDSMEIASTTKVRDRSKSADVPSVVPPGSNKVEIKVGPRRTSFYDENFKLDLLNETEENSNIFKTEGQLQSGSKAEDDEVPRSASGLKDHNDSMEVISHHVPERDHVINYEKTCPMAACQRKHLDTFMNSLPLYMRASPFTHFAQTYDEYETCSPEQLEILKQRIEDKKKKEKLGETVEFDPLLDWKDTVEGVGVQTCDLSYLREVNLPPCTCRDSIQTLESNGAIFKLEDLIPVKQNMDQITKDCLYDDQIEFHRFKVIGQDSSDSVRAIKRLEEIKKDFTRDRLTEIQKILKQHPSLLDIFQANMRC